MKIAVLVKEVPDTYDPRHLDPATGRVDRSASEAVPDEITDRALEVALSYKDADKNTEVVLLSMGPASVKDTLRKGLSMGADSAVHVLDDSLTGADLVRTAEVLSALVRSVGADVVLAGNQSSDGNGGVIPAMIAEHLGWPHLTYMNTVEIQGATVAGERGTEHGTARIHAALPAIVSVTERNPEARFPNFKGIFGAKRKPLEVKSTADLGVGTAPAVRTVVLSATARPARSGGTIIVDEGDAGVKLAEFLASGHHI